MQRVKAADKAERLAVEVKLRAVAPDDGPAVGGRTVIGQDERVVFEVEFGGDGVASRVIRPDVVKEFLRPRRAVAHLQIAADERAGDVGVFFGIVTADRKLQL